MSAMIKSLKNKKLVEDPVGFYGEALNPGPLVEDPVFLYGGPILPTHWENNLVLKQKKGSSS